MKKSDEKQRDRYYASETWLPPECDVLCLFRPCYNKYENKGSFTPGRGYTKYHDRFYPVCGTRMNNGCPAFRGQPNDQVDTKKAIEWCWKVLKDKPRLKTDRAKHTMAIDILKALSAMGG
jgi:hypothetical protein